MVYGVATLLDRYEPDYVAVEGDVKLNNFMFNAIAKYPQGRFHQYTSAGLGFSYSDMSATATQRISGVTSSASVGKDYISKSCLTPGLPSKYSHLTFCG